MTEPQNPEGQQDPAPQAPPTPYPAPPAPPAPPAYPAYGQQPGYGQWMPTAPPSAEIPPPSGTNGFAIAALVVGLLPVCGLVGVVLGIVALVQISRTRQKGKGLAIAGIVLPVIWIIAGAIALVIVGLNNTVDRNSAGEITRGGTISAYDLRVGDCIKTLKDGGTVSRVHALNCSEEHQGEVFATFEMPGTDYPGDEAFNSAGVQQCSQALRGYAPGVDRQQQGLFFLHPDRTQWGKDERTVYCILWTPSGRTGSVKG